MLNAGYGNCIGVPTLGGEIYFEDCYSQNPLVNVFCLGVAKQENIFYGKASGVGNSVIYVGAKTGRDGIHGATMASAEFDDSAGAIVATDGNGPGPELLLWRRKRLPPSWLRSIT